MSSSRLTKFVLTHEVTAVGLGLAVVILVGIGAWMYRAMTLLVRSEELVSNSHEVIHTIGAGFLFDLVDAQSGRRGFIINGNALELTRYQTAVDNIRADLDSLLRLAADNPNQQRRVHLLQPLVTQRLALWQRSVELRKVEGLQVEREVEMMQEGREINKAIQQIASEMEREEGILLEGRRKGAQASAYRALQLLVGGTLVSIALITAVFVLLVREITQRTQAETELRHRTAELETANKELEAFSYSVSHDLRNPLAAIDGYGELLQEEYTGALGESGCNYLQRVRAITANMLQLISDLLHFSLAQRAELQREPVDLSALAQTIAAELRETEPNREITFIIAPELAAAGDRRLLHIALRNLLGNAWKFTRRQPDPRIELGAMKQDGELTYFVRDNGVGFDMANARKVFVAFQRLHNAAEFPGTGIGLATVNRIIQRHGGRVWTQAAVDQGATFYFTL